MKKAWLLSAALLATSVGVQAQTHKLSASQLKKVGMVTDKASTEEVNLGSGLAPVRSPKQQPAQNNVAVFSLNPSVLGSSGNAYSQAFSAKAFLYADPFSGIVTNTHRSATSGGAANTNNVLYDYSSTKGSAWFNDQLAFTATPPVTGTGASRYPEGVIYNPNNAATTVATAPYVFATPTLHQSNDAWGGFLTGAKYADAAGAATATDLSTSTPTLAHLIPDQTWSTPFAVFTVEAEQPSVAGAYVYNGNLLIHRTDITANAVTPLINTTTTKVPFPVTQMGEARISFSPDGSVGYLSMLADDTTNVVNPDITLKIYTMITIDSGMTWTPTDHPVIDITQDPGMLNIREKVMADSVYIDSTGAIFWDDTTLTLNHKEQFTTGFTHDASVDKNGNLHIITEVASNGDIDADRDRVSDAYSIRTSVSLRAMVHFWTDNQGGCWLADTLGRRLTFREDVGAANCDGSGIGGGDGRPQIAMDKDGEAMFFAWFDTDTVASPSECNSSPDFFMGAAMLSSTSNFVEKSYAAVNVSKGTGLDGQFTLGNISSQYVFDEVDAVTNVKTYQVPASYAFLSNPADVLSAVTYFYISGADITENEFDIMPITTWNGFCWDYGAPDATRTAIIDGSYDVDNNGDIVSNLLTVTKNGVLAIRTGGTVVADSLDNIGSIVNCGGTLTTNVFTGNATTTGAPLTTIGTQPVDVSVLEGQPATFAVSATGTILSYEWYTLSGTLVSSGSIFTIPVTTLNNNGTQFVVKVVGACEDVFF